MPKSTSTPKPDTEPTPPVVNTVPVDPSDAHGVGATEFAELDPRRVHLTVKQLAALLSAEKPA